MKPRFACLWLFVLACSSAGLSQGADLHDYADNSVRDTAAAESSFATTEEALAVIKRITDTFGGQPNFVIYESTGTSFAVATMHEHERVIFYNAEFMRRAGANDWIPLAILAHEVGHHINGHLPVTRPRHEIELEADHFSGCVLARLGATLEHAQSAVHQHASDAASRTHPAKRDRLAAIERGYHPCRRHDELTDAPRPDPVRTTVSTVAELVRRAPLGGAITLERGVYRLNRTLEFRGPVDLVGSGREETFFILEAPSGGLRFHGEGSVSIVGLSVERASGTGPGALIEGSLLVSISNARFAGGKRDEDAQGHGAAVTVTGNARGHVHDSIFADSFIGLDVRGPASLQVVESTFRDNEWAGIRLASSNSSVEGNGSFRNEYGISVEGSSSPTIRSNMLSANRQAGLAFWFTSSGLAEWNQSWGNRNGIVVRHDARPLIRNNVLYENTGSGIFYGERAAGTSRANTIERNHGHGIVCVDTASASITLNELNENRGYGWARESTSTCASLLDNPTSGNGFGMSGVIERQ